MDYTEGALDTDRRTLVKAALRLLDNKVPSPGGADFSETHLIEMMQDASFYGLTRPMAEAFALYAIQPRPWLKEVRDCDNQAHGSMTDMADAAARLDWRRTPAYAVLSYYSKSLKGYHAALLFWLWNESKGDFDMAVLQNNGEWQEPKEEIEKWVCFSSR